MMSRVFLSFVFLILFSAECALAAFPVPPGSTLKRRDVADTGGGEKREMWSYQSAKNPAEVAAFYRQAMTRLGYVAFLDSQNTMVFNKGDEMFFVIIVPAQDQTGKTMFVLTKATKGTSVFSTEKAVCADIPGIPKYPDSTCMQSVQIQSGQGTMVTYVTRGAVDEVVNFYRANMSLHLWKLEQEQDMGGALAETGLKESMASRGFDLGMDKGKMLVFRNPQGKVCRITVMDSPIGRNTMLSIMYGQEEGA